MYGLRFIIYLSETKSSRRNIWYSPFYVFCVLYIYLGCQDKKTLKMVLSEEIQHEQFRRSGQFSQELNGFSEIQCYFQENTKSGVHTSF